jgi:hypothetical protein
MVRVRAERLTAHERNVAMTQLVQVTQGELGCPPMVENNVGDAGNLAVPGNGDDWNRQFVR